MATTDTELGTETVTLPVLPLVDAVLLPGTVATITLDTDDARAAVTAARADDGRIVVVPAIDGRSATVGVLAHVEQVGQLPTGIEAAIVRAVQRGALAAEVVSERGGRWQEVTPLADGRTTPRVDALVRELRVVLEDVAALRRSRRLPEILRTTGDAGALDRRRDRLVRGVERPPPHRARGHRDRHSGGAGAGVVQGAPGRAEGQRADPDRRHRGGREAAAGVPPTAAAGRDPQGAGRRRRRSGRRVPHPAGGDDGSAQGEGGDRQGDRPPGAHQRAEPRAGLDPHLARPRAGPALGPVHAGEPRSDRGARRCSMPTITA